MTDRPLISPCTLAVLFRSAGEELGRSLPLKEKPAEELPPGWRLTLMGVALRVLTEDSNRVESLKEQNSVPLFTLVLTGSTKGSEDCPELRDNSQVQTKVFVVEKRG